MSKYSKEDIIRMVREDDVEFIRMQFTDIFGQLKNVAITASQIEKAVNNEIMIDGSSIEGFVRINESDQYATGETMVVVFDEAYTYNGGNLLIGFDQTETGNWPKMKTIENDALIIWIMSLGY